MSEQELVSIEEHDEVVIASVNLEEVRAEQADLLLRQLRDACPGPAPNLVVDLWKVVFLDSVALGMLVVLLKHVRERGGQLALVGLSAHIRQLFHVTGLDRIFLLAGSREAGIASLKQ